MLRIFFVLFTGKEEVRNGKETLREVHVEVSKAQELSANPQQKKEISLTLTGSDPEKETKLFKEVGLELSILTTLPRFPVLNGSFLDWEARRLHDAQFEILEAADCDHWECGRRPECPF